MTDRIYAKVSKRGNNEVLRFFSGKGSLKNHLRHDKDGLVRTYALVELETVSASEWNGEEKFYFFSIRDTDISAVIQSETTYEAFIKFSEYLEVRYPDQSFSQDDVQYRELDVT